MTPLFSSRAPWARRALILTGLLCLPVSAMVTHEVVHQQRLEEQSARLQQQLTARQQVVRQMREAHQRRLRQHHQLETTPPAIHMLDNIGNTLTPDIALLGVEISTDKQDARLTVSSTSLDALLAFSERLQKLPAHVVLENHRQSTKNDAGWPINAVIGVHFPGEKRDETPG
jgi:hypothetical protein